MKTQDEEKHLIHRVLADSEKNLSISTEKSKEIIEESVCKCYTIFSLLFLVCFITILIFGYELMLREDNLSKQIERPLDDKKIYKHTKLSNDMSILFISDPNTDISRFSLELKVGFNAENGELPGISHLLTHHILISSTKHPKFFFDYLLKEHNGHSNFVIDVERTNFYFEIKNPAFENAVTTFSDHVLSPKLDGENEELIDYIDKEFSEYIKKSMNKKIRLIQFLANRDHIFSKFHPGNKETFSKKGVSLKNEMSIYFNEYYSSNLMNLVFYSKHSIEHMEKIARENFNKVKNNRMPLKNMSLYPKPFSFENTGKLIRYLTSSEAEEIELNLVFPLEEIQTKYKTNPTNTIFTFFNHKGEGSLYSFLKGKELIYEMESSILYEGSDFTLFQTKFTIPKNKMDINFIIKTYFAFNDLIMNSQINQKNYEFLKSYSELNFFLSETKVTSELIQKLAKELDNFSIPFLLKGDKVFVEYDQDLLKKTMAFLNPANCIILIGSNGFSIDGDLIESNRFKENVLNDNDNSHIFRFTDLNSLRESIEIIKGKKSLSNKMLPNKSKLMSFLKGSYDMNEKKDSFYETQDFSNIFKESLNAFDENYNLYFKMEPLNPKFIFNLSFINASFLNQSIHFNFFSKNFTKMIKIYQNCALKNVTSSDKSNEISNISNETISLLEKENEFQLCSMEIKKDFLNRTIIPLNQTQKKTEEKEISILNLTTVKIFYKFSFSLKLPKFAFFLYFKYNLPELSAKSQISMELMNLLIFEKLKEDNSELFFSNIDIKLKKIDLYIELSLNGNKNEDFINLLPKILKSFLYLNITEFNFIRAKKILFKQYREEQNDEPIIKAKKVLQKIISGNGFHIYQEKILELDNIIFDDLKSFMNNFHKKLLLKKVFIHGNVVKNESEFIVDNVKEIYEEFLNSSLNLMNENNDRNATTKLNNSNIFNTSNGSAALRNYELAEKNISQEFLKINNHTKMKLSIFDKKNEFGDKNSILYYFQFEEFSNMTNSLEISILSRYLKLKLTDFIRAYSILISKINKLSVIQHNFKIIDGILVFLEYDNDISCECLEILVETFFENMDGKIKSRNVSNSTFYSLKKLIEKEKNKKNVVFFEKSEKNWKNILKFNIFENNSEFDNESLMKEQKIEDFYSYYDRNPSFNDSFLELSIIKEKPTTYNISSYHSLSKEEYICGLNYKKLASFKKLQMNSNKTNNTISEKQELFRNDSFKLTSRKEIVDEDYMFSLKNKNKIKIYL